jgi:hypothetical protein
LRKTRATEPLEIIDLKKTRRYLCTSWGRFNLRPKFLVLNLLEIHGARLNSFKKFKKTQAFPFFGPSPRRDGMDLQGVGGDEQLGEGKRDGKNLGMHSFS